MTESLVSKVWSFCNVLRDDGVSYGDYLEQITYLLFLKMADEYSKPPYNRKIEIPDEWTWPNLRTKRGAELETYYVTLLRELGKMGGMLGRIFARSQNKISDPAKLYRIVQMIDQESWVKIASDVKGDIYLTDLDNLPSPSELAGEIIENIEAGLESFKGIIETLKG